MLLVVVISRVILTPLAVVTRHAVIVGQDNDLVLTAKNIRAFGHEMDTAENDVAAFGLSGLKGELERVTSEIGELNHFVALVVVAQNHDVPT